MASPTPCAPSFSRCSLRRYTSAIRTGCANERPSGSVEGVVSDHDPYSDRQLRKGKIRLSAIVLYRLGGLGGRGASMVFGGMNSGEPSPGFGLSNWALSL